VSSNKIKNRKQNIDFNLYLITDRRLVTRHSSLVTAVRQALKGGVKVIQLREKDLNTQELLKLAYKMRDVTEQYDARLFINNSFDVALAAEADGVHLTQNSIPVDAVRKTVKAKLLIGVSTHSLKEARAAEKGGADFITFGPVYRTHSKLRYGPPQGLDNLEEVCSKVGIPVFAIGGIKSHRIDKVKKAGAFGVAMISEIFGAEDIKGKAKELVQIIRADVCTV
jgi:thiamine-phosphate pyrophosphorylase